LFEQKQGRAMKQVIVVSDRVRVRAELLRRIGLADLLHPSA
jgi:hypothetical protein